MYLIALDAVLGIEDSKLSVNGKAGRTFFLVALGPKRLSVRYPYLNTEHSPDYHCFGCWLHRECLALTEVFDTGRES
jgi:hypothetical protein